MTGPVLVQPAQAWATWGEGTVAGFIVRHLLAALPTIYRTLTNRKGNPMPSITPQLVMDAIRFTAADVKTLLGPGTADEKKAALLPSLKDQLPRIASDLGLDGQAVADVDDAMLSEALDLATSVPTLAQAVESAGQAIANEVGQLLHPSAPEPTHPEASTATHEPQEAASGTPAGAPAPEMSPEAASSPSSEAEHVAPGEAPQPATAPEAPQA